MASRRTLTLVGVALLVIVTVVSLVVSTRTGVSPAQAAANAAPPAPGPTSAEVERRPLVESLSLRGAINSPAAVTVIAPVPMEGLRSIVTRLPVGVGDVVSVPSVVAEIAGRPIIVVSGGQPFYRDLTYGDSGPDVAALQAILGVEQDATFGAGTQRALSDWYQARGYTVPTAAEDSEAQEEASDALQPLLDGLEDAKADGADAVASARADLAMATAAQAGGTATAAETALAQTALKTAVTARDRTVSRAERDVAAERARLNLQQLREGPKMSASELVAVSQTSLSVIDIPTPLGAETTAGQPLAVLGDPTLEAAVYVNAQEASEIKVGQSAEVTSTSLDPGLRGEVIDVATTPEIPSSQVDPAAPQSPSGSAATSERPYRVRLSLSEQIPPAAVGTGVLVTITVAGTASDVIAVPLVALQQVGNDEVVITLPARKEWVVRTGASAQGWVELVEGAPPVGAIVETR